MIEGFVASHSPPNRIAMTDSASAQEQPHAAPAAPVAAPVVAESAAAVATAAPADDAGAAQPAASGDRVKASPLARRLAEAGQITLGGLSGDEYV